MIWSFATHGRAFWILDDISLLRTADGALAGRRDVAAEPFRPTTACTLPIQFERRRPVERTRPTEPFLLISSRPLPKSEVTLEFSTRKAPCFPPAIPAFEKKQSETPPEWPDLQAPPEVIPAGTGFNRFTWGLAYDGPHPLPGEVLAEFRFAPAHRRAGGNYQVKAFPRMQKFDGPLAN